MDDLFPKWIPKPARNLVPGRPSHALFTCLVTDHAHPPEAAPLKKGRHWSGEKVVPMELIIAPPQD